MYTNRSNQILAGIKAYLRDHFPDVDFYEGADSRHTGSTLLVSDGGGFRLAITETFLDGDDGALKPLRWVREWNVARVLRQASGQLVTLTTKGAFIGESLPWTMRE